LALPPLPPLLLLLLVLLLLRCCAGSPQLIRTGEILWALWS